MGRQRKNKNRRYNKDYVPRRGVKRWCNWDGDKLRGDGEKMGGDNIGGDEKISDESR